MSATRTTKLEPGTHSVERVTPKELPNGSYIVRFRVCLATGRTIRDARQGPTKGIARARARERAEELLLLSGFNDWKTSSKITDYVEKVTKPAIAKVANINSRRQYEGALRRLMGGCEHHVHQHSLRDLTVAEANDFRTLEACLQEISDLHGDPESARQSRNVWNGYVAKELKKDRLIVHNVIAREKIDYGQVGKERKRGGRALRKKQYRQVVDYLLALDPAEGIVRRQGRWSIEHLVNKAKTAIDMTLLQTATGLRVSEATLIVWSDFHMKKGTPHVHVRKEISKTKKARTVPVIDQRVYERVIARRGDVPASAAVFGRPADQSKFWDESNRNKALRALYIKIWRELKIDIFEDHRSHVWRATLNTLLAAEGVPLHIRAAYFGHDEAVNVQSYTDTTDTSSVIKAARRLVA